MESEAVNPAAAPLTATSTPPPVVPVAMAPIVPPPQVPAPTSASHMGWLALSIVLFIIGLLAGSGGGYYLGIQQTSGMFQTETLTDTSGTVIQTETEASSTNPLNDVKLNPFE